MLYIYIYTHIIYIYIYILYMYIHTCIYVSLGTLVVEEPSKFRGTLKDISPTKPPNHYSITVPERGLRKRGIRKRGIRKKVTF